MPTPLYAVTGATGKTGAAIVRELRAQDQPVRAIVRRHDARSEALRAAGAEIVTADLFDAPQLAAALRGTRRAYYCPPFHPFAIQSAAAFADAAREIRLEAVVGLSQWLASPNSPSLHTRQLWLIERMLANLPGIAHITLNAGYFADNYLRLLDFATLLGVFPIITGDSRNAPPANEDIARAAVALLRDPDRHAGKSYRPTGPALLSAHEMVPIIAKVIARPVRGVDLPFWMLSRAARQQGVPAFDLLSLRDYIADHKAGAFALAAPNDVLETLTGQPAEDFETTTRRYAALPFARRTLANRLRKTAAFLTLPFTRGHDLADMPTVHAHPAAPAPASAMDDQAWRRTHTQAPIALAAE